VRSDGDRLLDMLDSIETIKRHTQGGREVLDDEVVGAAVTSCTATSRLTPIAYGLRSSCGPFSTTSQSRIRKAVKKPKGLEENRVTISHGWDPAHRLTHRNFFLEDMWR